MTGEIAGYVMEKLLNVGALDVFYTSIYMKKNRPAIKLTVLCREHQLETMQKMILKETTTIGIRMYKTQRICMERKILQIHTPYGDVNVKEVHMGDITKYAPEYEDCKKIAETTGMALKEIYGLVINRIKKDKEEE